MLNRNLKVMGKYTNFIVILVVIMLISLVCLLSSCDYDRDTKSSYNLTQGEKDYINNLLAFKDNNKDNMVKYMYIFINHRNAKIPEEDLEFIKDFTKKDYYDNWVKYQFIDESVIEYTDKWNEDEMGRSEGPSVKIPSWYELPDTSGLGIMRYYYFYKSNTYATKVSDQYGNESVIYFKVEGGKVVDISEL